LSRRGEFEILYRDRAWCPVCLSSSHTSEARGLKFGMHNPHMDGSKVTDQIFDILPRSSDRQWDKFAASSLAIKIWQTKVPEKIYVDIFKNTYTLNRKEGRLFGFDSSKTAQGRAMTKNWIGSTLGPWTDTEMSNDQIRRLIKRSFWNKSKCGELVSL